MNTALLVFVIAVIAFFATAALVQLEKRRGRRLVGDRVRVVADAAVEQLSISFQKTWHHFTQYVLKLGWYYSLHSFLRTLLQVLVSLYTVIENIFERNRAKTKALRMELKRQLKQTHFTKIADHKADTSLTLEEQERLKRETLEYEH